GIVQNAVKYGGPHIEIAATAEADRFVLEVRDDGPGVPTAEVPRIFQPFRTGHSGQRMGTGIGLAVARSIVADMGGLLEYRAGDPGAVFALTLHVESDSPRAAPLDAEHERPALLAELIEYERDAARLRLNRLAFRHRATEVIEEVVRPVMYDLGDQWARGEVSVSQEHHASSVVQSWLMDALARFRPWRRHSVVCVSGPGSHHEIGTASVAVALAEAGYRVIYLGRGVPVEDLVKTVGVAEASALMVSVTLPEQLDGVGQIADALREQVRAGLIVGVGGHLFWRGVPAANLPALYLGQTSTEAVASLDALLAARAVR
ncbi:MAG TPA: ATP-binding protein, partial [Acidimicrobiia bacterium]|nr:ATP-binding protein [Acidimicrobiia bacterium]